MKWSETTSCYGQRPSAAIMVRRKGQALARTQYPDYLVHYGIAGQRWGIRRYQNEDGTLTEEGKLRYNEGKPESETWNKGEAKYLTDRELQRRNNRLNQERQYREALTTESERNAKQIKSDIIKKVIAGTAISLAAVAMRGHWKQAASFIGKYGKRAVASLRTKFKMRNVLGNAATKYGRNGLDPIDYPGRMIRGKASSHIKRNNIGVAYDAGSRLYNYRPHINNAMPKSRRWPSL